MLPLRRALQDSQEPRRVQQLPTGNARALPTTCRALGGETRRNEQNDQVGMTLTFFNHPLRSNSITKARKFENTKTSALNVIRSAYFSWSSRTSRSSVQK